MKESDYRKNVGAMVVDSQGKILVGEASFCPGEWMMPQGGIKSGEAPLEALWRELEEETGICQQQAEIIGEYPDWLYYTLRKPLTEQGRTFLGQKQKWFVLRYEGPIPNVEDVLDQEFLQFRRASASWLLERTAHVKTSVYKTLFDFFSLR